MLSHFASNNSFMKRKPKLVDRPNAFWAWATVPDKTINVAGSGRWAWVLVSLWTGILIAWFLYRGLIRPVWVDQIPDGLYELMTLLEAGSVFTLVFLWSLLMYRQARPGQPKRADGPYPMAALTADEMYLLSPADFEKYTAALFRQKGYQVKVRGRSGDSGVDLDIRGTDGRKAVAQCKRYNKTVGAEIVRELFGTMIHERASHAFLITTAGISPAAREWAQGKPITLIDGQTLEQIAATIEARN